MAGKVVGKVVGKPQSFNPISKAGYSWQYLINYGSPHWRLGQVQRENDKRQRKPALDVVAYLEKQKVFVK